MNIGTYIYYRSPSGDTLPGRILKFGPRRTLVSVNHWDRRGNPVDKKFWVQQDDLEEQRVEREIEFKGFAITLHCDIVDYHGKDVVRFELPCTCRLIKGSALIELGVAMVGGESGCPVHGFGTD